MIESMQEGSCLQKLMVGGATKLFLGKVNGFFDTVDKTLAYIDAGVDLIAKTNEEVDKIEKQTKSMIDPARQAMKKAKEITAPLLDPINKAVKTIKDNSAIQAGLDALGMIEGMFAPVFDAVLGPLVSQL